MSSPQYLFFPQTEGQRNRTFPTVWWHLRMRERPPGFQLAHDFPRGDVPHECLGGGASVGREVREKKPDVRVCGEERETGEEQKKATLMYMMDCCRCRRGSRCRGERASGASEVG
jgi:hypothetical protein